jgi:hypothetical protein
MNLGDLPMPVDFVEIRGVFRAGNHRVLSLTGVGDGTSQTMLYSEAVIGAAHIEGMVKGGIAMGADIRTDAWNHRGSSDSPEIIALDWLDSKGPQGTLNAPFATSTEFRSGWRWADGGMPLYTGVYTILPPNSLSVARGTGGNPETSSTIVSASSYHPGGVNCASVDGAVRFVSDSVSTTTADIGPPDGARGLALNLWDIPSAQGGRGHSYSGRSPYGVWGAYGSANGGESVSLP